MRLYAQIGEYYNQREEIFRYKYITDQRRAACLLYEKNLSELHV